MLNHCQSVVPPVLSFVAPPIFPAPDLELDVGQVVLYCEAWMSFDKVGHLILLAAVPACPTNKGIPIPVVSEDQVESQAVYPGIATHILMAMSSSSEL